MVEPLKPNVLEEEPEMTLYQQQLLEEAIDMWSRGFDIPLDLYAKLAEEDFDVPSLEEKHKEHQ